jgi:hypothetical protein
MKVDNRWGTGSLANHLPETYRAAYGARWIDNGSWFDVVPDRQGFAYDDPAERDALIERLQKHDPMHVTAIARDVDVNSLSEGAFHCWMRRTGGYVYVDAWLE